MTIFALDAGKNWSWIDLEFRLLIFGPYVVVCLIFATIAVGVRLNDRRKVRKEDDDGSSERQ